MNASRKIIILSAFIVVIFLGSCNSMSRQAAKGDIRGVQKFLDKGENINQHDKWGWTPLFWAVYYNYTDLIEFMIKKGADVNARTQKDYGDILKDTTPLLLASYYGYDDTVRLLLHNGADKNMVNRSGESPYSVAEKYDFFKVMVLLDAAKVKSALSLTNTPEKHYDNKTLEFTQGYQVVYLNDGKKMVGKIEFQNRERITLLVDDKKLNINKEDILEIRNNR